MVHKVSGHSLSNIFNNISLIVAHCHAGPLENPIYYIIPSIIEPPRILAHPLFCPQWNILGGCINEVLFYKPTPTFTLSE